MQDAIPLRVSITPFKSISEDEKRGGNGKNVREKRRGAGKVRWKGEKRRNILVVIARARRGKDATEEELQECDGGRETVCGAAGGRGRPYTANPRQPHSITMLSRIQMTVISFGTPYT